MIRTPRSFCLNLVSAVVGMCGWFPGLEAAPAAYAGQARDLESLRVAVSEKSTACLSFQFEGVVRGVDSSHKRLVVEDERTAVLLALPDIPPSVRAGSVIKVSGANCWTVRSPDSIQLGVAPLIDSDGIHNPFTQSAGIRLEKGDQAFRLEWFNGGSPFSIGLEVEGPGHSRSRVPASWFKHPVEGSGEPKPGLNYRCYLGEGWYRLPDFQSLKETSSGVAADVDPSLMIPRDNSGVVFSGVMTVPESGEYTFYLTSDDGARLHIGTPNVECELASLDPPRTLLPPIEGFPTGRDQFWGLSQGTVTFASWKDGGIELEMSGTVASTQAVILDSGTADPQDYLGKVIKVTGLKSASGIVALDPGFVEIATPSDHPKGILTTAAEVHQLRPKEAAEGRPVKLVGVVTRATFGNFVLQDSSGGVFVYCASPSGNIPKPREIWEIIGTTDDGDFSPMVFCSQLTYKGTAELPKGQRPTGEQFADGSLDAEQVEIRGIVASSTPKQLELITQDGTVYIKDDSQYPLVTHTFTDARSAALVGSVVNLRGVFTATWDDVTGRVIPFQIRLGNAALSIESPAPADPFATDLIKASDLLLFNSGTRSFQRMKVAGTVLFQKPSELFVHDGTIGFRVDTRNDGTLSPGDQVEVVGFPRLQGATPVLLQAQTRKTGSGSLPQPTVIGSHFVSDVRLDSSLVTIQGSLLNDTKTENSRMLELEKDTITFLVHVPFEINSDIPYRRGSLLEVTGVYVQKDLNYIASAVDPFEVDVGELTGVRILQNGPWWTQTRTLALILMLCCLLVLTTLGVTVLRRTVVKRTEEIAVHIREREAIARQQLLDQERNRVAHDLHDELGAGLTEAGILVSLASNPSLQETRKLDYLHQLGSVCRSMVTGLDEIVWALNPNYDAVADLAGYLSLFAQRFLHLAGIHCRLNIQDPIPPHHLESQLRHEIFLAFKEAVNNVVKHSGASVVHLAVEIQEALLIITIEDNGSGFDLDSAELKGEGLRGMKARIRKLGGEFHLSSERYVGTIVTFRIPLPHP